MDAIFLCEPNERLQITRGNRDILANFGSARISRCAENALSVWRLPQFPCKGVFAAPTANDQNFHGKFGLTVEAAVSPAKAWKSPVNDTSADRLDALSA